MDISAPQSDTVAADPQDLNQIPAVTEVLMIGLGSTGKRPLLLARSSDHELLAYEAFTYYGKSGGQSDRLHLRFKKLQHGLILRERKGK